MSEERKEIFRKTYYHVRRMNGSFKVGRIEDYVLNPHYRRVRIDADEFNRKLIQLKPSGYIDVGHTDVFYDYERDALWFINYLIRELYILDLPE